MIIIQYTIYSIIFNIQLQDSPNPVFKLSIMFWLFLHQKSKKRNLKKLISDIFYLCPCCFTRVYFLHCNSPSGPDLDLCWKLKLDPPLTSNSFTKWGFDWKYIYVLNILYFAPNLKIYFWILITKILCQAPPQSSGDKFPLILKHPEVRAPVQL